MRAEIPAEAIEQFKASIVRLSPQMLARRRESYKMEPIAEGTPVVEYQWSQLLDSPDKVKMLSDPDSTMVKNATVAFARVTDDTIKDPTVRIGQHGDENLGVPIVCVTAFVHPRQVEEKAVIT